MHEEDRERGKTNIGHFVLAIGAGPPVRQVRTAVAQRPNELFKVLHMVIDSEICRVGNPKKSLKSTKLELLFLVEARDWARLPERFHGEIERDYVVLDAGKPDTTHIVEGVRGGTAPQSPPNGSPGVTARRTETRTGGRPATTGTIAGDFALSVGMPDRPAPEGWRWTKITDVARLETGHTPSRKHPEYWGGEVPWIGIKDATGNHGRTIYDTIQHTNELGIANSSARILPEDTVCLSRTASVGYVVVMGCPMATSQDFVNWVCSPELDHRFLKYVLLSEHSAFLRFASGTTHQTIYFPEVKAFHVGLPSPAEQRAIAHILGVLDDKIEVNRRMNATLEAMARAVFKDWFVDFRPTRARMEGRKPYLAPEIWDLFPDRLDDEGRPEGWETYMLGNLANHHRATTSPAAEPESTFEHYSIPAYDAGNEPTLDSGESIKSNKTIVPEGVVLLSKLNPEIERVWLPNPKGELPQVSSTEFLAFTPLAPATRSVLFCMFKSEGFRAEMAAMVTGTSKSHQRVPPKALLSRDVLVADARFLDAFDSIVRPLLNRLLENRHESRTLAEIRDLLLPKLMSGEIRLKDAERTVEEVT